MEFYVISNYKDIVTKAKHCVYSCIAIDLVYMTVNDCRTRVFSVTHIVHYLVGQNPKYTSQR